MATQEAQDIGLAIGVAVAASLALQAALGPAMSSIVEAIMTARLVRSGRAGLVSLAIGTFLGLVAGVFAYWHGQEHDPSWIAVGAFAGLIGLGAGGVRSNLASQGLRVVQEKAKARETETRKAAARGASRAAGRARSRVDVVAAARPEPVLARPGDGADSAREAA